MKTAWHGFAALIFCIACVAQDVHVRVSPDVKTGIEGTTEFPTIQNALDHHLFAGPAPGRDGKSSRVYIEIAAGTYHERVIVTQNHQNITFVGMGRTPAETVITNSLNAKAAGGTFFTETAEINGDGFEADNITFENAAGNTGQAVAVAVRADRAVFKHVRFLGHQDTLFADYGRQYYVECFITGGVDYIFGNATAIFDRSELESNAPGFVTAQSRTSAEQTTGYVILNPRVTISIDKTAGAMDSSAAGASTASAHVIGLGRPWRPYSRVVYIGTSLPEDLSAAGWNNWGKTANEFTAYYAELGSTGPGANSERRVPWAHRLSTAEARAYLPANFLRGKDGWNAEAAAANLP